MAQWMDSIVQTYIQVWNGSSPDLLDGIATSDVIRRSGSLDSTNANGIDALKEAITGFRVAFPDTTVTIKERADGESQSLFVWEFSGTNTGPGEFSPTGKAASVTGATLIRYRDGKMAEEHVYFDVLGFMQQLGLAT
jgi:steroid delta-isomerase-like uncharacterized protein